MRRARRLVVVALALVVAGAAAQTAAAVHGGSYTTATGEQVRVLVSDAYPVDEARNQRWADFLASLVHGPELASATLHLAPPAELWFLCGPEALACYDGRQRRIFAAAEPVADVSPEAAIAHEYGHHVALSRNNAPWPAVDWGTKRWATYAGICAAAASDAVAPGNEQERYALNPGEAFAEVYRVLNERRLGLPETPWEVVARRFLPDERALALVELDVVSPWEAATLVRRSGRATQTRAASVKLTTPLDGRIAATVRSTVPLQVELLLGGRVVSRATARTAAVRGVVCGTRTASLRIRSTGGGTTYSVTVARP